jgi:hypothetical protein
VDLAAHALAERGVDQPVSRQRQLAAEGLATTVASKCTPSSPRTSARGAGQALFDQLADGVGSLMRGRRRSRGI